MTFPFFCFSFYPYLLTFGSDGRLELVHCRVVLDDRTVYRRRCQLRIHVGIIVHHRVRHLTRHRVGQYDCFTSFPEFEGPIETVYCHWLSESCLPGSPGIPRNPPAGK